MRKSFALILLSVVATVLFSCSQRTALKQFIHDADVVKVYIYSGSATPMVHYETNDVEKIKEWANYIDESTNGNPGCTYEGKLVFKAYDDSTTLQFSLKDGCQQAAYTLHDSTYVKKLTPAGISFINGLKQAE